MSWKNKINDIYYIIQISTDKIIINKLLEEELYSELETESKGKYICGFIYYKNNKDYLYCCSSNGYINVWDLYNKKNIKLLKLINILY